MEDFVLNISLCNGQRGRTEIGEIANCSYCLAAQIVKKINELCPGEAEILPIDALAYDDMPLHTISFYKVAGMIAAHDEGKKGMHVQGIHSLTEDGASVKKARYNPPKPSMKRKYEHPTDDGEKPINKKIKVEAYTKEDASCPNIRKGDEGTLLFETSYGDKMFFFDNPSYRGEYISDGGLKFVEFSADE